MTRVLFLAVVVAQLFDVATWMAMPRAAEVNPLAQQLHSEQAWLLKGLLVVLVGAIQPALHAKYRAVGELVAVLAIAAGCVGAGANIAVLSVHAAEAPRPDLLVISTDDPVGVPAPKGHVVSSSGTEAGRTPAPGRMRAARAPRLSGVASWYEASGLVAAAGPELRRAIGPGWRGTRVRVVAGGRSVLVRLSDWCQCYRGTRRERLVDLSDDAFARLAPLTAGLIRVRLERVRVVPPETDTWSR